MNHNFQWGSCYGHDPQYTPHELRGDLPMATSSQGFWEFSHLAMILTNDFVVH